MYRPPSASAAYYDKIIDNLELASSKNMGIIVMADLNFNYILDESLSTNPVHLIENLFLLQQLIDEPTRATLKSSTLIDVILSSSPEEHIISGVLKTTFSDHYSIFTVLQVHKTTVNYDHKAVKFGDYKNFKDEAFLNDINSCSLFDMVKHETDIDNGWEVLKSEFKRVSDAHAPFVERRLKHRNNPWITPVTRADPGFEVRGGANGLENLKTGGGGGCVNTLKIRLFIYIYIRLFSNSILYILSPLLIQYRNEKSYLEKI